MTGNSPRTRTGGDAFHRRRMTIFVGRSYGLDFAGKVIDVPDVSWQKMAVGAGPRFSLRASVSLLNRINLKSRTGFGPRSRPKGMLRPLWIPHLIVPASRGGV